MAISLRAGAARTLSPELSEQPGNRTDLIIHQTIDTNRLPVLCRRDTRYSNRRCHNHDFVEEAFVSKQTGEADIISVSEMEYRLVVREPLSRSTHDRIAD
ncbi:hypothetical protein Tco_1509267 [Tanacetum coccineum]